MGCPDKFHGLIPYLPTEEGNVHGVPLGAFMHRLSRINETTQIAHCSACGVVPVVSNGLRGGKTQWRCSLSLGRTKKAYTQRRPEIALLRWAKRRADKAGVPFAITSQDILKVWPSDNMCPILRVPFSKKRMYSPSLDRIRPTKGYVPGNIAVMSRKANGMKQNETDPEVFRRLATWLDVQLL
jgi:hypothetical protein